jgi:hypothetical protein
MIFLWLAAFSVAFSDDFSHEYLNDDITMTKTIIHKRRKNRLLLQPPAINHDYHHAVLVVVMMHQHHRVPMSGDPVHVSSMEKTGRVLLYHQRSQRYEILVDESTSLFLTRASFELTQSEVVPGDQDCCAIHILVSSYLHRERCLVLFLRSVHSLLQQVDHHFSAFLYLAGPMRDKAVDAVYSLLGKLRLPSQWYILNGQDSHVATMEQLRQVHRVSRDLNPVAWLLFLASDDLFHPQRVRIVRQALIRRNQVSPISPRLSPRQLPFFLGAKLVLQTDQLTPSDAKLEDFWAHDHDFDHYTRVRAFRGKIRLACGEPQYFDYCVPSPLFTTFLNMTPLTHHAYCTFRWSAMLQDCTDLEPFSSRPWLLVHRSTTSIPSLQSTYNRHDLISGSPMLDDSLSIRAVKTTPFDRQVATSRPYRHLSPAQIALCRRHMENFVVQNVYWNEETLEHGLIQECRQIDLLHGRGLGRILWTHCLESMEACFSEADIHANQAWRLQTRSDRCGRLGPTRKNCAGSLLFWGLAAIPASFVVLYWAILLSDRL